MKRGAIELSVGTIVVIVLAISMLIMGLVLIANIRRGTTDAIDLINNNVKAQINSLFNQDDSQKTVVYLPGGEALTEKGRNYNIQFAIKNTLRGESGSTEFRYEVAVSEIEQGCRLTEAEANEYIILGKNGRVRVSAGSAPEERTIVVRIPEEAPLCSLTYNIDVTEADGSFYDQNSFILTVE